MSKIIFILTFLLSFGAYSQTDTIAYLYAFGGLNNDNAEAVVATSDGGYVAVGSTSSNSSGNTDVYLLKVDSLCNYEWSFALGGSNNDWGYAVKQTFDKGFIIAANSNSDGNAGYNAVLYKRDSLGNNQWTKRYGGQDWDFAYDVVQTYDSGFVFCGETYNNTNGFSDVYIVKTNNLGDTLWTRRVGGALVDRGNAIIETSDSNLVVAGIRNTVSDSTQAYLIKLNSTGTVLWDSIYGGVGYEVLHDVIQNSTGSYTVAGATTSNSNGDLNYYVLDLNQQGTENWNFTIVNAPVPFPDDDELFSIAEMPNGQLLFIGYSKTGGASKKNIAMFTLVGGGFWGGFSTVIGPNEDEVIKSVLVKPNNRIVGAGFTTDFGNGNEDLLILKMDTIIASQTIATQVYYDIIPITVKENQKVNGYLIYPTLIENGFKIKTEILNSYDEVVIFDLSGKIVLNQKNVLPIVDVQLLKNGFYVVALKKDGVPVYQTKIIKQ